MEYRIRLTKGRDGYYVAQCLEVPGAISQGRTKQEALRLVLGVLKESAAVRWRAEVDTRPPTI